MASMARDEQPQKGAEPGDQLSPTSNLFPLSVQQELVEPAARGTSRLSNVDRPFAVQQ